MLCSLLFLRALLGAFDGEKEKSLRGSASCLLGDPSLLLLPGVLAADPRLNLLNTFFSPEEWTILYVFLSLLLKWLG
jgi:hypothetical protein